MKQKNYRIKIINFGSSDILLSMNKKYIWGIIFSICLVGGYVFFFGDVKKIPHVSESQEIENNLDKIDQEDLQVIDDSKFVSVVGSSFHTKPDEVVFEDPTESIERNTDGVTYTDSSGEKKYLFKKCSRWHEYRGEEVVLGKVATGEECVPENYFRVNDNVLSSKILYIAENAEFILMTTTGSGHDGWNYFLIEPLRYNSQHELVEYKFHTFETNTEYPLDSFFMEEYLVTEIDGLKHITFRIGHELTETLRQRDRKSEEPSGYLGEYAYIFRDGSLVRDRFIPLPYTPTPL